MLKPVWGSLFFSLAWFAHIFVHFSCLSNKHCLTLTIIDVFQYVQFVAVMGSITKSKEFKSQMKAAYDACNLQNSDCISQLEVHFRQHLNFKSRFG